MSNEAPLSYDADATDALVIEAKIVPLSDGDTERRDRQGREIVALLRGVLARPTDSELRSSPRSDLVSDDFDGPRSRGRSGQQCSDRVGSLGRTGAADRAPRQPSSTSESEGRGSGEQWVSKRQLAEHLAVTPRWIEYQQRLGLPHLRVGGMNRYRVSEVEAWLRSHCTASASGEGH